MRNGTVLFFKMPGDNNNNNNNNPLKNKAKFQLLLQDVDSIKSDAALASWRKSFSQVFQEYLDPDVILNARDADGRLVNKTPSLGQGQFEGSDASQKQEYFKIKKSRRKDGTQSRI
jgi:hypothetical protein